MAKKAYKRTGDMLFHRIIGNSSYPEVTAGFISDIMGVAVEGVQILNPYNIEWYKARSEDPELMTTGVDVLVSLRDGTRFIVECQQAPQSFFLGRVFFYAASRYIENYAGAEPPDLVRTSGYKYKSLHSVHTIALTSFVLFEADDSPMHRFVMYDVDNGIPYDPETGGVGIPGPVSFTFLELAKLMKADNRLIQLWIDFFRGVELQADAPDYLKRAEWLAEEQNMSEEEREMINERELAIQDRENQIDYAIKKGREEGRLEGREENKATVARTALGFGMMPEMIAELTGLSLDAVMRLQEELADSI